VSKAILITGASRGIGRATAILAAQKSWSVGINFLSDGDAANRTVAEVETRGGRAIAIQGDISVEPEVLSMFQTAENAFGALDGFVNNAGIVAHSLPLAEISAERLKRVFDVNVYGAYLCAREAARYLSKSHNGKGGAIVNVSSAAARLGAPLEYVDYAGSKGAIDTLTLGLAKELGPQGVRVNAVRPGLIDTDIHASGGQPDRAARLGAGTALGREGTAEEVAEAILWLLGDGSSYVTGALLDVSAGR